VQYILVHVIKKMGDAGVRNATFGAGATEQMQRVENIGGFRVRTLEKAYNGISHTFNLGNKGDFRSKFGSQQDPVSGSAENVVICAHRRAAVHLLPEGPARRQGRAGDYEHVADGQVRKGSVIIMHPEADWSYEMHLSDTMYEYK
jgi:hypothetical protein